MPMHDLPPMSKHLTEAEIEQIKRGDIALAVTDEGSIRAQGRNGHVGLGRTPAQAVADLRTLA